MPPQPAPSPDTPPELLGPADLIRRWRCGSASTLWRAEADGLLVPHRLGRRKGYAWPDIWAFEGGQPPAGMEAAYRAGLLTPEEVAKRCPLKPVTIIAQAKRGALPCRRIGSRPRFVPAEVRRWLGEWA